jgi:signal transduction histidine kinase/CheY-like chemotaxis protein
MRQRSRYEGRPIGRSVFVSEKSPAGPVRKVKRRERTPAVSKADRAEAAPAASKIDRATSVFLATLSHELRTPLSTMLWWVRLLRDAALDEVIRGRALDALERNLTAQARLIEDLFDLSSILTGRVRLHPRPIDLVPVIEAAIDAVYFEAHVKGLRLDSTLPPRPVIVRGDPDRLQQVVVNLLLNAIKFSPHGARVSVRLESVGPDAKIAVIDNGRGISRELLPAIFDRFRQGEADAARSRGGLGLGLAIARDLVQLHGGRITAHSAGLGLGATFTITLPLVAATDEEAPGPTGPRLAGLRILVVVPAAGPRHTLAAVLTRAAAAATPVTSSREALNALETSKHDVLVIDVGAGRKACDGLIQAVRRLGPDRGGRVPAVALTAHGRAAYDRIGLMAAGFQACVSKPVEAAELIDAIVAVARGAAGTVTSQHP